MAFSGSLPFDFCQITTAKNIVFNSSVASPICQEGQSERNFQIFAFSSRFSPDFSWFFPDFWPFFRCQGWHSAPPCHPTGIQRKTKMSIGPILKTPATHLYTKKYEFPPILGVHPRLASERKLADTVIREMWNGIYMTKWYNHLVVRWLVELSCLLAAISRLSRVNEPCSDV